MTEGKMQSIHKVRSCLFRTLQKQMRFNPQVSRTRPCLSFINGVGTFGAEPGWSRGSNTTAGRQVHSGCLQVSYCTR